MADVPDVSSWSSARTRWSATTRTWQRGAGGPEQSQFQPSVRSVMVALGVFAGFTPSVGARRHQRSLFWGLHLRAWQRFRVEVNGKRQRDLSCLRERAGLSWWKACVPVSCVDKINGYSCSWSPGYEERLSAEYVWLQQEELRRTSWHRQCWSRALEVQMVATKKKSTQLRKLMDAELRIERLPESVSESVRVIEHISQSGRRLWAARKAPHLHEPNHEGNGRSIHNKNSKRSFGRAYFLHSVHTENQEKKKNHYKKKRHRKHFKTHFLR